MRARKWEHRSTMLAITGLAKDSGRCSPLATAHPDQLLNRLFSYGVAPPMKETRLMPIAFATPHDPGSSRRFFPTVVQCGAARERCGEDHRVDLDSVEVRTDGCGHNRVRHLSCEAISSNTCRFVGVTAAYRAERAVRRTALPSCSCAACRRRRPCPRH